MKTAEEIFSDVLNDLGFEHHKPSEMSNSYYYMITMESMKRYANMKLDLAAEEAHNDYLSPGWEFKIDRDSILKLKDKI